MVFLEGLKLQNALMFLFSMIYSYLLTAKTTPEVNNSLIFTWCERATVCISLHVRSVTGYVSPKMLLIDASIEGFKNM